MGLVDNLQQACKFATKPVACLAVYGERSICYFVLLSELLILVKLVPFSNYFNLQNVGNLEYIVCANIAMNLSGLMVLIKLLYV